MKSTQSYLQIKCSFSWNTYERKLVLCIQWSCIVVISISSRLHTEFQLHHKEKDAEYKCNRFVRADITWKLRKIPRHRQLTPCRFLFPLKRQRFINRVWGEGGGEADIYIYIQEVCVLIFPFYSARYVEVERDICCDRGKKQRDYTFIPTSLFLDCSLTNHETGL